MAKEFYTEKDIEDMFKRGILSLDVNDNVVLTEMAYEKANRLGMRLLRDKPDNPPSAPVRPYVSQKQNQPSGSSAAARPALASTPTAVGSTPSPRADGMDLAQRIRNAVLARLGSQVDPNLLDVIIKRVLNSTGLK
jgi:hypothetical protein